MTKKFIGRRRATEASVVLSSVEIAVQPLTGAGNLAGPEIDLGRLVVDSSGEQVTLWQPCDPDQSAPGYQLIIRERGRESRTVVTKLLFEDTFSAPDPDEDPWPDDGTVGFLGDEEDLNPTRGRRITEPGTVIENEWIDTSDGGLIIAAADVVVRNCRFSVGIWGVDALDGATNLVVEDCSFDGGYQAAIGLSQAQNWRISRCDFYNGRDAIKPGGSGIIEDCITRDPDTGGDAHNDSLQFADVDGVLVRRNRLEGADTSCIAMFDGQATYKNVTIQDNLLTGAGYLIYAGGRTGQGIRVIDNVLGEWGWGPVTDWDGSRPGNEWSGNVDLHGAVVRP